MDSYNSTGVAINKVINNCCCSFIAGYHCSFEVGSSLIVVGIRYSDAGKR